METTTYAGVSTAQLNTIERGDTAAATTTPARDASSPFVTKHGESIGFDPKDPASLEAWFGNYGHAEHFRKVVLASAREAERARATERQEKVTEARLDDLARVSDKYVDYLITTLNGRRLREQNVLASLGR